MQDRRKTVAAHTLGCKVNQHETEAVLELFRRAGYEIVDFNSPADVYLINTCTVTHLGDRKSRQVIRQARRRNPAALLVVMGCYAQRAPEEMARIEGVNLIVGNQDRTCLVGIVEGLRRELNEPETADFSRFPRCMVKDIRNACDFEELPLPLQQGRTRALVKIEDGCNQYCSYCIVPLVRGPVRSRPAEKILEEIALLVEHGYQEVVLTGIHTSAYGQDWQRPQGGKNTAAKEEGSGLPEERAQEKAGSALGYLLERILREIPQLKRLRISSLEPTEVPPQVPELMRRYPAFCRHLHLPLQSGNDAILALMRRPYTTQQYAGIVEQLRSQVPGLAITTDVMVGFPGETEAHFEDSFCFIRQMGFSNLHVFKYSPRPGTAAEKLPGQVPFAAKEERSRRLLHLAEELRFSFAAQFLGEELEVLLEEPFEKSFEESFKELFEEPAVFPEPLSSPLAGVEFWEGYSDNYLRIAVPLPWGSNARGKLVRVRLVKAGTDYSRGEIIGK